MDKLQSFRQAVLSARYPVALAGAVPPVASQPFEVPAGYGGKWMPCPWPLLKPLRRIPARSGNSTTTGDRSAWQAAPNRAHTTLARLSTAEVARKTFPSATSDAMQLITQNVDGLSIRAGKAFGQTRSVPPIEMHGSLFRTRCTRCHEEKGNFDSPICSSLAGTEDLSAELARVPVESLPRCSKASCGGLLRPAVVWFGESIPELGRIQKELRQCDLLLVLGTSSTVYPAAGFADQIQSQGGKVAVFNLEESSDGDADWFFQGGVEDTLPAALRLDL